MLLLLYIPVKVWDIRSRCLSAPTQAMVIHPEQEDLLLSSTGRWACQTSKCFSMRSASPLFIALSYHAGEPESLPGSMMRAGPALRLQVDERAGLGGQLSDGHAAAAHDEVGGGGHLLARDVDELAAVVHDPRDAPLRLQRLHPADGILRMQGACEEKDTHKLLVLP